MIWRSGPAARRSSRPSTPDEGAPHGLGDGASQGRLAAEDFALLFDRTQILGGGRQRYGTQIAEDEDGESVVFRLDDPEHVDECRAAIGLGPLRDYLKRFPGAVRIER